MKQFVRGRCSRAISSLLVVLFMLPTLTLSLVTAGQAESEQQNIILLPLTMSVGTAPENIGAHIFQELQLALASHLGTQVSELTSSSPIYLRARKQMTEEDQIEFDNQYKIAIDPSAEKEARQKAAGVLVKKLRVDCLIYGAIDHYEFTTDPDPKQTLIHLTATKIKCTDKDEAVAFPIATSGRSKPRVNDHGSQAFHDREAISNIAHNLADALTGTVRPPAHEEPAPSLQQPSAPTNNMQLYALLGGALLVAAIALGSSGGGHSSGSTSPTSTLPAAPTTVTVAMATQQISGMTVKLGYPQISWTPSTSSSVTGYQIWRDTVTTTARRIERMEESKIFNAKLPTSPGARTRIAHGRVLSSLRMPKRTNTLIGTTAANVTSFTDSPLTLQNRLTYTYSVVAVSASGSSTATVASQSFTYNTVSPAKVSALSATPNAPQSVQLSWTAPVANTDGSSVAPGSFLIFRSTTLSPGTSTVNSTLVTNASSGFASVGTPLSWTTTTFTDANAPTSGSVSYVILAVGSNGTISHDQAAPVIWATPFGSAGIVLSANANAANLSVVSSQNVSVSLNGMVPGSTQALPTTMQMTATVYQNGQFAANQAVLFSCTPQIGTFLSAAANTNSSGQAIVTYQAGTRAGVVNVTATCNQLTSPTPIVITQWPGTPAQIVLNIATPTTTGATGTVSVEDVNGNLVPNQVVALTLVNSSNSAFALSTSSVATGATGTATFTVTNNGQAGSATVSASMSGVSPQTVPITFTSQANPQIITGNQTQSVTVGSTTSFTMAFRNPSTWQLLANTQVWAQVVNPSVGTTGYSLANTGGLSVTGGSGTAQSVALTTDANGQVYITYTAASQAGNNITVTFYNTAGMQNNTFNNLTPVQFNIAVAGPTVSLTPMSATEIDLGWTPVANATTYLIQRSKDNVTWTTVVNNLPATNTTYKDGSFGTLLQSNTTYYYQVAANIGTSVSQFSPVVSALTFPAAPTGIMATPTSTTEIDLTWNTVPGATGYRVYYELTTGTSYSQFGADLPASANATYPTFPITGLTANTSYNFEIVAFNTSGATYSASITQNTLASQTFTVTTPAPQIYYSSIPRDIITNVVPLITPVTIKESGGANSSIPVGSVISITTDRGSFVANGAGQTLSNNDMTITGKLDSTGSMAVVFQGRSPNGTLSRRIPTARPSHRDVGIVLPAITELGTPILTATTVANGATFALNGGSNTLPLLIGPPNKITMAITNPSAPSNTNFYSNVNAPWGYATQTLTATATVYDLNNQPVLAGMPIWFGQSWTPYSPSNTPSAAYYQSAVDAAYISPSLYQTDVTGKVNNVVFGSNHSGEYTLQCFALLTNSATNLAGINNINPTSNSANLATVQRNSLTTDNSSSTSVSASQVFWIDTAVASNATAAITSGTTVNSSGWGFPSITVGSQTRSWNQSYANPTPTTLAPPLGVSWDGSQWAKITVTGQDSDGKWVLPGTPFSVSGEIFSLPSSSVPTAALVPASLFQNGGSSPITASSVLYFNNLSQGDVVCKGNGTVSGVNGPIGYVTLTYNNCLINAPQMTTVSNVAYIYGQDPSNTANLMNGAVVATTSTAVIAGSDIANSVASHQAATIKVSLLTSGNQPFPEGYLLTLCDNGVPIAGSTSMWNGNSPTSFVSVTYSYSLNGSSNYTPSLTLQVTCYTQNGLQTLTVPVSLSNITVERPVSATVSSPPGGIYMPMSGSLPLTAVVNDYNGAAVFDGYTIQYQWVALANSPPPNTAIPNGTTSATGTVTTNVPLPPFPGIYAVQIFCKDGKGNTYNLVQTGAINVGFQPPTIAALTSTNAAISLQITDPNIANGLTPTDYYINYSSDGGKTWSPDAIVPSTGNLQTPYLLNGLTATTSYEIRVRAQRTAFDGQNDFSLYSGIITQSTI